LRRDFLRYREVVPSLRVIGVSDGAVPTSKLRFACASCSAKAAFWAAASVTLFPPAARRSRLRNPHDQILIRLQKDGSACDT